MEKDKKEFKIIQDEILENSEPLIQGGRRLAVEASKQTQIVADFVEKKIINDINQSIVLLKQSDTIENKRDFLIKSLLFWKMCKDYPKTAKCVSERDKGNEANDKIKKYILKLNQLSR